MRRHRGRNLIMRRYIWFCCHQRSFHVSNPSEVCFQNLCDVVYRNRVGERGVRALSFCPTL